MKPTPLIRLQGQVAQEEALIPVVMVCGEGILADFQHVSSIERSAWRSLRSCRRSPGLK